MTPVVGVVYDVGAASPNDIASAARGWCVPAYLPCTHGSVDARVLSWMVGAENVISATGLTSQRMREDVSVTTFAEAAILETAQLAERLRVPFHSTSAARVLADKGKQRRAFLAQGIPSPQFVLLPRGAGVQELAAALATLGPAVLKPRRGMGSRGVRPVATAADVLSQGSSLDEDCVLEQQLIGAPLPGPGWLAPYLSVEVAVTAHGPVPLGVSGRLPLANPFRETGMVVPAPLPEPVRRDAVAAAIAAAESLGPLHGLLHVELMHTDAGFVLIEVNGRLGGCVQDLYLHCGIANPVEWALRLSLGRRLPAQVGPGTRSSLRYLVPAEELASMPKRDLAAVCRQLLALPGVWRAAPTRRLTGQATATMSSPLSVWIDGANSNVLGHRLRAVQEELRGAVAHRRSTRGRET